MTKAKTIYTIGHSTKPIEDFLDLLKTYEIELLIDVRTIPKSKFNPQYNEANLSTSLEKSGMKYLHLTTLGGLRHTVLNSVNLGWHNLSFRGFADYMQTPDFKEGLKKLETLGKEYKCAIMCAEALPWKCHRSMIADALTVKKWKVFHIMSKKSAKLHELTKFIHVEKRKLTYPTDKNTE